MLVPVMSEVRASGALLDERTLRWMREEIALSRRPRLARWMGELVLRQIERRTQVLEQRPVLGLALVREALRACGHDPYAEFHSSGVDPHKRHQ